MNGSALALLANSTQTVNGTQVVYDMYKSRLLTPCNDQSDNIYPVSSGAFDEEFEVREEENIKTPRCCSPSVDELIRKIPSMTPNTKLSRSTMLYGYPRFESTMRFRSLAELACKPSPYPLDKLYDESIPLRSVVRAINESPRVVSEPTDKPRLTKSSVNRYPSVRLLENIQPRPPIQMPMRSMSSAGLIGDFTGLSFQMDTLSVTDGLLSMPSASKFLEIDQSLLSARNMRDTDDATTIVDVPIDFENQAESCFSKELQIKTHDLQFEEAKNAYMFTNTQLDTTDQSSTGPHKSASKLTSKKKVSSSSTRKQSAVTRKIKDVSDSNDVEWPDSKLLHSLSLPTPSKQESTTNSGRELVINIENSSSGDRDSYGCDFKVESQSNDSGNHSISSNSDINSLLKTEVMVEDHALDNQRNSRTSPEVYFSDVPVEQLNEYSQMADEEFTLVTNKKMRKKMRSQMQSDKPSESQRSLSTLTNGHVKQSSQQTIPSSQSTVSNNHFGLQSPRNSIRVDNRSCSNNISYSNANRSKYSRSSRWVPTSKKNSSLSLTPSHSDSSFSISQKFPKSSGVKRDLGEFKNSFKNKEAHDHKRSSQLILKENPKTLTTNFSSFYSNKVSNNPSAPFCIDPTQHRLLIQFLISSWKSFRSGTTIH